MKIRLEQLPQQLKNQISPIYFISGEELLLVQESCDLIRQILNANNYDDRIKLQIDNSFNWQLFSQTAYTNSLFSEKTLLELNLGSNKIKDEGKKALEKYAQNPPTNKVLLIIADKIDAATQKNLWYQTIEKNGIVVQIWPINKNNLNAWIAQRMKRYGLTASSEAINILAEYAEGNLFAAAQEIEKLSLIYVQGALDTQQVTVAISDNAHFSIYDLVDNILMGNVNKIPRILKILHQEKIEPILILWAFAKELRVLSSIVNTIEQGTSVEQALQQQHVWEQRKPYIKNAVSRHNAKSIYNLIRHCARLDCIIKGVENGNIWNELTLFSFKAAVKSF